MSSPPKLLVFRKSSEEDEKQDDGEVVDKHDGEAKMSKEENEVVCIATTASTVNNGDGDHDDGYHTPTSPRHKIPKAVECPPAPRKRLCRKRVREQVLQRYRQVVGVVVCEIGDDDVISPKAKKARGGGRSTIANGN